MLVGGADVSGDKQGEGQRNYIAFLVGTEERINRIYRDIGINGIHMAELSVLILEIQHQNTMIEHKYNMSFIRLSFLGLSGADLIFMAIKDLSIKVKYTTHSETITVYSE